ncbi:MAG: FAD-dependent oxidoreductase [Gammaproteobacteria bacterium]|nr:FAD-dependent oxidoreductase [Gammaproteobacteria bacterium]NIR83402.1 FAD-dependent oxidoreductase [Gammaproteobacteria bacterium]NIR91324.1 FAD-dependent oxidoreductase [Gammaproteobacteria bacterium]NIU04564.1 FAD-dependent oxidoreductase [Gammaproteobacteria bacterium]NIV51606.1 FAD-dependent oxidoreductase [Gammaproteobacteria bacterium]
MSASNRLPAPAGLLLDRDRLVRFTFEGKPYQGFAGDTIASALAASGVRLLSRSFKYHRPRGLLTMAGQDGNTLVQLPGEPNVNADREPITEGLAVMGQHYSGSLVRDRDAWLGRSARFLPVGFYYKAFYKPKGAWEYWEPLIRRKAGLGKVDPTRSTHGYYDKMYTFCDVLVVGGGPAGLCAAREAAGAGADVLLVDENPVLGGALTYARFDASGELGERVRGELVAALEADPRVRVMTRAVCNGYFADNWLPVICGNRMYKVRATEVIVASGCIEQPAVFRNNDLPGVMQGSAAQRLIRLYGVRPGRRAVVLTANRDGYGVALDLLDAGVDVAAVIDLRETLAEEPVTADVFRNNIRVLVGHGVLEAIPSRGGHLKGIRVARITGQGVLDVATEHIDCDLLCMSPGYISTYQLLAQAGARVHYDEARANFVLRDLPPHVRAAGSVSGAMGLEATLAEGRREGWSAARALGLTVGPEPAVAARGDGTGVNHPWPIFPHPKGKDFVDFDEDLQVADIVNACREGYEHLELVKRFSTAGMGPSQGRHSALTTARLVANVTGRGLAETGVTTARPPFTAEKLAHCAGRSFEPERHTPMHQRHLEAGAHMMIAGLWLRPGWYGPRDARERCMQAECLSVRNNVGLIDVSTLGGIEVRGPQAGEFLNRVYTYGYAKQAVGRARYVVMTNEQGTVVDDGVACRLHEQRYYVTATTGGVEGVYRNMLFWQAQWRLDVEIAHVTSGWCGVNIAGPRSRDVLAPLCADVDLSPASFPYMGVREGTVAGIAARLIRVGFVGELGYEIHVPAGCGEALWDALTQAGSAYDIRPFGLEAQRLLRLEKGHIIIGQDTDSMSHPHEVQLAWAISRRKPFFVGGRSIDVIMRRPLTRQLVGFVIHDTGAPVPEESHLVIRGGDITGRVTSCGISPTLGAPIGLAYVAPDQAAPGARIRIRSGGGVMVEAEVASLPFYDPENQRQEM